MSSGASLVAQQGAEPSMTQEPSITRSLSDASQGLFVREPSMKQRKGPSMTQRKGPFGQPLKWLPVFVVCCTIAFLWYVYAFHHCLPLLQIGKPARLVVQDMRQRGIIECGVFHFITFMLLFSYVACIFTSPGGVPKGAPEDAKGEDQRWSYEPTNDKMALPTPSEMKKSGERRGCKWCAKYKPDRAHHCSDCEVCVLKMDHHCAFVHNCIGYNNHKYFFLMLVYAVLDCHLVAWSMLESTQVVLADKSAPIGLMFMTLFGETLAFFLGFLLLIFLLFHVCLMCRAVTTIELCEQHIVRKSSLGKVHRVDYSSPDGVVGNIKAVLGSNPALWLLPVGFPVGDGLEFPFIKQKSDFELRADRFAELNERLAQSRSNQGNNQCPYGVIGGPQATLPMAAKATPSLEEGLA